MQNKLINQSNLSRIKNRIKKKKIVLCHGVFDLLHTGHLDYFESAKKLGDILIISITSDKFVNKGPGRPYFEEKKRIKMIQALEVVDYVYLNNNLTAENVIEKFKPSFYVKGPDYKENKEDITKNIYKEITLVKKFKGKIVYTSDEVSSSSNLLNNFFTVFNKEQQEYKKRITNKYSFLQIKEKIDKFSNNRIITIGETIVDDYIFSESIGKSGKEPHLVIKDLYNEKYLGGVIAIAKHLEGFSYPVNVITLLGEKPSLYNFIKNKIGKKINFNFITKKNSPTIIKKRIVDKLTNQKLLGIYSINDRDLYHSENEKLNKILFNKKFDKNDLVILSDYGHGFINSKIVKKICKKYNHIYLNAQLNASNIGYHSFKNYNNFNTLIVNESELRHEYKDKKSDIKILMKKYSALTNLKGIVVTRGANGAIYYDKRKKSFINTPAFSNKIIDKVGAGDAFLAIFSICDYNKFDPELSMFFASLAAASSVESMGNSKYVNKEFLLKSIQYFLK
jgi:rfaE bifunctional protein kinase chain/domain/rfaE bifunctional protein nucleotidyltransferase chain/domain|tara:strand:- start:11787 stop:13307 length:1521 start_codon:yes stop_codon:yes gene_type:complete